MTDERSQTPTPSPATGQGQEILQQCLRAGEAFDKAFKEGDPLILEALAAFESAGQMREPIPRPSSMKPDPQIEQALARFQYTFESPEE